ncbi:cryptochrome/photolyase family protein [Comamonas terrae]|uniref:Cryptochrome/photolyase family protein n=1 Tax=Comamonas terrae TaxID=673548 RepID=A0ABW5UPP4_9BURK|nr:deoxyribodipyrimidine photo-lyase [Comamonas terrae]
MTPSHPVGLIWFRRDLRLADNAALYAALQQCKKLFCVFIFDDSILAPLPHADRRVEFICQSLAELDGDLRAACGRQEAGLITRRGLPQDIIPELARQLGADAVFCNDDDEPAALARDAQVAHRLRAMGRSLQRSKDHRIFGRDEVLTQSLSPFSVFTPYKNAWLRKITPFYLSSYPSERDLAARLADRPEGERRPVPTAAELGFEAGTLDGLKLPTGASGARELLDDFLPRLPRYQAARDYPALKGPSYLSVHLRFGTVSIRELARTAHASMQREDWDAAAREGAATWLSELIWRDFYFQILAHHPHVVERSFKPAYDAIVWDSGPEADALFAAWCAGRTGYPLVDAAMRQLAGSGYMHNRLRMVAASFLVKDLGIDWRRGEAWFAEKLNDFDLAANNGGWQWAASTGCDAQPWFRIFNPVTQSQKFDPEGRFIARYVPELARLPARLRHAPWLAAPLELAEAGITLGRHYPHPVVDHAAAREKTLARYAVVKAGDAGSAASHS